MTFEMKLIELMQNDGNWVDPKWLELSWVEMVKCFQTFRRNSTFFETNFTFLGTNPNNLEVSKYIIWNFQSILELSKYFGTFQIFWNFPNILELSKYFGTFQIFWNFPNILELSKYFGRFQVFWNFQMFAWV